MNTPFTDYVPVRWHYTIPEAGLASPIRAR